MPIYAINHGLKIRVSVVRFRDCHQIPKTADLRVGRFALATGCRAREILDLEWNRRDDDGGKRDRIVTFLSRPPNDKGLT